MPPSVRVTLHLEGGRDEVRSGPLLHKKCRLFEASHSGVDEGDSCLAEPGVWNWNLGFRVLEDSCLAEPGGWNLGFRV